MDRKRTPVEALADNRLLATMLPADLEPLVDLMEPMELRVRDPVYENDEPFGFAYFPVDGVISMIALLEDAPDNMIEVATIGNEGMVGLSIFLGASKTPGRAFVQVPGAAFRMKVDDLRAAAMRAGPFSRVLHRYTQALLVQVSQSTACNRVHSTSERCARWILMTHDRMSGDEFELTQQFLGQMLGERRAAVNEVATMFQNAGFIRYSRGRMALLDRAGLEATACGCYRLIRNEYETMFAELRGANGQQV